jgi:hypothetical protein
VLSKLGAADTTWSVTLAICWADTAPEAASGAPWTATVARAQEMATESRKITVAQTNVAAVSENTRSDAANGAKAGAIRSEAVRSDAAVGSEAARTDAAVGIEAARTDVAVGIESARATC